MSAPGRRSVIRGAPAMRTAVALCAVFAVMGVLGSCGAERALSDDESDLCVWFIEDVAHSHQRRPEELVVASPSTEMRRLTAWLAGGTQGRYQSEGTRTPENYHPPGPLAARANRWSNLHALFLAHQLVELPSGLVAARPDLPSDDMVAALPIVDHENLDRRALDALIAGMCAPGSSSQRRWLERAAAARVQLDIQGGAELWHPPAPGTPTGTATAPRPTVPAGR